VLAAVFSILRRSARSYCRISVTPVMMSSMSSISSRRARGGKRRRLALTVGRQISRFQEASYAFDDVAAEILALSRSDLPVMTALLFGGPASVDDLVQALHIRRPVVSATLNRLQLAGYARFQSGGNPRIELTAHASEWIERIWAPLRENGFRVLEGYSMAHLALIARFLEQASTVQEARTASLRRWLSLPSSPARRPHLRGGLSPAALQRVQLFVESNLGEAIHLRDLAARATLSPYHFARAFKTSVGMTPRSFVEHRRVERAKRLLTESAQPLAIVAVDSGFGTQSRLTTVFKRHTGFTPAVYRRGHA
jgi:AraC family transcriptional regulator